ncbi:MAG: helix-turn-helix transcriptional regulator [Firmicutes bacterium]|jgi:ArsR family transcriptional regulator|nr:helix-turn-helix transcriptional regulator [Bacillota bacterium]
MRKNRIDVCDYQAINPEAVRRAREALLDPLLAERLADTFKVLGDRTRVNLLSVLADRELCVCDLAAALGMSSSAVSHQLRVLRDARLVKSRRDGKMVYYSLDDQHVVALFEQGLEHVGHTGEAEGVEKEQR